MLLSLNFFSKTAQCILKLLVLNQIAKGRVHTALYGFENCLHCCTVNKQPDGPNSAFVIVPFKYYLCFILCYKAQVWVKNSSKLKCCINSFLLLLSQEYLICLRQSLATNILSVTVNGFEFKQVNVFE